MIDLCTDCRRKHLGLASRHKLAVGGDRLSGAGVREGEHPDMGSFRGVIAAHSSTCLISRALAQTSTTRACLCTWEAVDVARV